MAAYTIEDIEHIRRRSGISYQEAVALLDYHGGDLARALIDLERSGRLLPENNHTKEGNDHMSNKAGFVNFLKRLYAMRIHVDKGSTPILNVSVLTGIISLLCAPWLVAAGVIASFVLGYHISYEKGAQEFTTADIEKTVRSATQDFTSAAKELFEKGQTEQKPEEPQHSYYQPAASQPAAKPYTSSAPTIQMPVKVDSTDGDVNVESEHDGHTSATVG